MSSPLTGKGLDPNVGKLGVEPTGPTSHIPTLEPSRTLKPWPKSNPHYPQLPNYPTTQLPNYPQNAHVTTSLAPALMGSSHHLLPHSSPFTLPPGPIAHPSLAAHPNQTLPPTEYVRVAREASEQAILALMDIQASPPFYNSTHTCSLASNVRFIYMRPKWE